MNWFIRLWRRFFPQTETLHFCRRGEVDCWRKGDKIVAHDGSQSRTVRIRKVDNRRSLVKVVPS